MHWGGRSKLRKGEAWQELKLEQRGYCFGDDSDSGSSNDSGFDAASFDAAMAEATASAPTDPGGPNAGAGYGASGGYDGVDAMDGLGGAPADSGPQSPGGLIGSTTTNPNMSYDPGKENPFGFGIEAPNNPAPSMSAPGPQQSAPVDATGQFVDMFDPGFDPLNPDNWNTAWDPKFDPSIKNGLQGFQLGGKIGGWPGAVVGGLAGAFGKGVTNTTQTYSGPGSSTNGQSNTSANAGPGSEGEGSGGGDSSANNGMADSGGLMYLGGTPGWNSQTGAVPISGSAGAGGQSTGAGATAGNAYQWFNNLYGNLATERKRVSDAATAGINTANETAGLNLASAKADRATYDNTFTPTLNKIVANANQFDAEGEANRMSQENEAKVGQTYGKAREAQTRQQMSYGFNPASQKFQAAQMGLEAAEAADRAAAANTGRIQGRELGTQRLVQAAQLSSPLATQAINEGNAAVSAGTTATQLATVPGATERADAGLVGTGFQLDQQAARDKGSLEIARLNANTSASNSQTAQQIAQAQQQAAEDKQTADNISGLIGGVNTVGQWFDWW